MNERNLIAAVALSFGVYVAWFAFVEKKFPSAPTPVPSVQKNAATPAPAGEETPSTLPPAENPSPKQAQKPIEWRTPEAEIEISPRGGALSSYRYRGPLGWVELVLDPSSGLLSTPIADFSPAQAAEGETARLTARAGSWLIEKDFDFKPSHELSDLRITFKNEGKQTATIPSWEIALGPGLGTVPSEQADNPKLWRAIGLFPPPPNRTQDALDHLKAGDYDAPWRWLAVDNRYFLVALLAPPSDFEKVAMESVVTQGHSAPKLRILAKPAALAPGESKTVDIPFYIGPKSYSKLARLGVGLEKSINFGWFSSLGRWILWFLQWLHGLTGNYGWSIILLTLIIQTALFPLTFKSLKSMAKMRKIQPEMAKLQQKFKDDPQRLNAEMMELYKSKGVNPMGGCLPMLAQMPIFVALFDALRNAWELHGAPWILWIHDLSAHDPFYILPLIMGGVMYVQNQLNPAATADPAQATMMKFMPVIFTFMFIKFPAGLVLYWLTNSILSTLQQLLLRRQLAT